MELPPCHLSQGWRSAQVKRAGRGGRYQCERCRKGKHGSPCVEGGRDHSLACITCEKAGRTAEECGPKTLPGRPNSPKPEQNKGPDLHLVEKVASLESDMARLKALISTVMPQGGFGNEFDRNALRTADEFDSYLDPSFNSVESRNEYSAALDVGVATSKSHLMNDCSAPVIIDSEQTNPSALVTVPSPRYMVVDTPTPHATVPAPRPKFGGLDSDALLAFISSHTTPELSSPIADHLHRHIASGPIQGIRAGLIRPITHGYDPWPLVTWREGDDTDVMAIFKVQNPLEPASLLMHYGVGRCWGEDGKRWKQSHIAWAVVDMEHMAELFLAASHVSGFGQMSRGEFVRVLGERSPKTSSRDELSKQAQKLVAQVSRLRQLHRDFEALKPSLERFSSIEVVHGIYGQDCRLMRASMAYP